MPKDPRDYLIDDEEPDDSTPENRSIKNLVPWLESPHKCDCGAYTDATHEYVEPQAMYMDVWKCPECGTRYYRDRL